jgi:hypothetical protein
MVLRRVFNLREKKHQEAAENCTLRSFIIFRIFSIV